MSEIPTRRSRIGAVAGLVGAATAFTFILGVGPVPSPFQLAGANEDVSGNCDEAEHASDPECVSSPSAGGPAATTSSTVDDGTTTTIGGGTSTTIGSTPTTPAPTIRSIDAGGAGTVVVAVEGNSLRLVAATPAPGWRVEVEQATGREVEVDFRSGTRRIQVNVELEDGQVRERVRVRDDADGTDVRRENGTVVRDDSDDRGGDDSDDRGDDDRGSGSDDDRGDDNGGSGHGSDDDRGSSSDDDRGDDNGGSGHGSDD